MENHFLILPSVLFHVGIISNILNTLAKLNFEFIITIKIHLKTNVIDDTIQNGLRQPTIFSFILEKPSGYKVFCEPETKH